MILSQQTGCMLRAGGGGGQSRYVHKKNCKVGGGPGGGRGRGPGGEAGGGGRGGSVLLRGFL